MVADSWFRNLWKIPRKHESGPEQKVIGVLAFEVASVMSKIVHLWQSLSDKQVARLREEITGSVGIKKLVSEDDEFIVGLICAELLENMVHVAKAVARMGKKCNDPALRGFDHVFDELIKIGDDPYGWVFTYKKMEKKVKKMERFILVNATLYQEMEMLVDLEQTVRRMKGNDPEPENLLEYQKKLVWKQQEVKNLKEISLWNRTYDYTVQLLVRSLFSIFCRINQVFGVNPMGYSAVSRISKSEYIHFSQPILQPAVYPSESSSLPRFASGPLGRFTTVSGPMPEPKKTNNFFSGPLVGSNSSTKSGPISGKSRNMNFFSGPLGRPTTKSGPISGMNKGTKKTWIPQSPAFLGRKSNSKQNKMTQVGPFKGCMMASDNLPVTNYNVSSNEVHSGLEGAKESNADRTHAVPSIFSSKWKFLKALPDTLGAAALALHYANVIIVIEKLAASPHLIGNDARDDLYNMLPANVRAALRERLKPCAKSLKSFIYDSALAAEWTDAMTLILEWLAPLAHSMIRWQSERSFEQQSFVSRTNVFLVQTLYFANQEKTEAAITELLVGLNYIWWFGRELNAKALRECASSRVFDEYLEVDKMH